MRLTLLSTDSSLPFAERLAARLGVAVARARAETFPDGERYLRLPLAAPFDLVGQAVVLVGATESATSLDDLYRLGCTAVKHGARQLILVVPYFGYSTMERAVQP